MKLKHQLVILSGVAAGIYLMLVILNILTEKYFLGALNFVAAVCYFGLATHWANRED